jgi:hypothetical protein
MDKIKSAANEQKRASLTMPKTTSRSKTKKPVNLPTTPEYSAGRNGAAITPPSYGIGFVDTQSAPSGSEKGVIQRVNWANKIQYQQGDRIYGRGGYYDVASESLKQAGVTGGYQPTVQSLIDRILPTEEGETYQNLLLAARSLDDNQFFTWFQTSKYWAKIGGTTPTKYDLKKLKEICKAGILFVTQQTGKKIHFILGGMLNDTVMKEITGVTPSSESNKHGLSNRTTWKELRSVYRNWGTLHNSVIFYDENGDVIPAPWEAGPYKQYWDVYGEGRAARKSQPTQKSTEKKKSSSIFSSLFKKKD